MNASSIQAWSDHPWITFLGWALVHSIWQITVLACLAAIVLMAFRRMHSHWRYAVAIATLALMVVLPFATAAWTTLRGRETPMTSAPQDVASLPPSLVEVLLPHSEVASAPEVSSPSMLIAARPPVSERKHDSSWLGWTSLFARNGWVAERLAPRFPWIVTGWSLGIAFLALRWMAGWTVVRSLRRSGRPLTDARWVEALHRLTERMRLKGPVELAESSLALVPAVIGWIRPMILVPTSMISGLTTAELEALLAHELAHIRRHDYLVNVLQTVVDTLFFFHPGVWWLSRAIRSEREDCCDDAAVSVCGNRLAFAKALARMEELRADATQLVLAASGGSLVRRIRRVVGHDIPSGGSWFATMSACCVLLLGLLTALGMAVGNTAPRATRSPADSGPWSDTIIQPPQSESTYLTHRAEEVKVDGKTGSSKNVLAGVRLRTKSGDVAREAALDMMYSNVLNYSVVPARIAKELNAVQIGTIDFGDKPPPQISPDLAAKELTLQMAPDGSTTLVPMAPFNAYEKSSLPEVFVRDVVVNPGDVVFTPYADDPIWLPDHLAFYNVNSIGQRKFNVVRIDEVNLGLGPNFGPVHALVLDDANSEFGVLGRDWAALPRGPDGEGLIWSANDGFFFAALEANGRMRAPSTNSSSGADEDPVPKFQVVEKDDDRVTRYRVNALTEGRSATDLINHFDMARQGHPQSAPDSIVDQETVVSAIPRWHIGDGMDADEITMSLPEGSGLRAELSGEHVEMVTDKDHVKVTVTEGRVELIDSVGVVRATASADGGATQLIVDCRIDAGEVVLVMKTNQADCPVQAKMNVDTGAALEGKDPPHRAIRYEIRAADTAQSRPLQMKMQWHYKYRELLEESQKEEPSADNESDDSSGDDPTLPDNKAPTGDGGVVGSDHGDEFGPPAKEGDLRLKLSVVTEEVSTGGPLLLKLEIKNFGDKPQEFDPQYFFPFRAVHVVREDGAPEWRIGPTPQTLGFLNLCEPGETKVLWEAVDVGEIYMLDEGEYAIHVAPEQFAPTHLPESNVVKVSVPHGELPPFKRVLKNLSGILPKDWDLSTGHGAIFLSHSPTGLKSDVTTISAYFSAEKPDAFDTAVAIEYQTHYIGKHELGHLSLSLTDRGLELWPNVIKDVREALDLSEQSGEQEKSAQAVEADHERDKPWSAAGKVTDDQGKPLPGVEVWAHCGMGTLHRTGTAVTDNEGRYELKFGPGIHSADETMVQAATISVHLSGFFEKNMHRQGDRLAALKLPSTWELSNDDPENVFLPGKTQTLDFVMIPAAAIRGKIVDADGKPASRVRVSLVGEQMPPSSSVASNTTADDEGSFVLENIPTGFEFQILVEPEKAESPWLAWASGPMSFVSDAQQAAHLKYQRGDDQIDFSTQSLTLVLNGEGVNWKTALETTRSAPIEPKYDGLSTKDDTVISAGFATLDLGK